MRRRKLHLSTNNVSWSLIFQDLFFIEIKSTMLTQLFQHIRTKLFCKSTQIRHFTAFTIFTQCSEPPSQGVLFDQGANWETMVPCFNSAHPCTSPDIPFKQGTFETMVPCYDQDDLFKPCNLCKTRYPGMASQTGLTKVPQSGVWSCHKYCYHFANIW